MTAERLPRFVPSPMVDRRYEVTVMVNRWDPDEGKLTTTVTAIGPVGARHTAEDKLRDRYPDVVALYAEEVAMDPEFCEGCGFAWAVHRNEDPRSIRPFGCPPDEHTAVERWGRAS